MRNRDKQPDGEASFIIPEALQMLGDIQLEDDDESLLKPSKASRPQTESHSQSHANDEDDWSEVLLDMPDSEEETRGKRLQAKSEAKPEQHSDEAEHDPLHIELLSLLKDDKRLRELISAELVSQVPSANSASQGEAEDDEGAKAHSEPESGERGKSAQSQEAESGKKPPQWHGDDHKKNEHKDIRPIPVKMEQFLKKLEDEAGYKTSFDIVVREMTLGGKRIACFFMNGLAKDTVLTDVLTRLTYLQQDTIDSHALHAFMDLYVPAVQVKPVEDWTEMLIEVLAGATAFYIEGESSTLIIDAKNFPARGPDEPSLERVVRGARDGFVETLMVNVSLVRRRLRDPQLRYEIVRVGERTQTDVCIAYIDDIADTELVESIRDKIKQVKLDGLPLADKQLEEATVKRGWNPYPLVRYSERPDVVAAHLLEGSVCVFVDTSPSVMLLPTTFFDLIQHAEENRQTPFIGTYLRWVRFIGIMASLFLLPVWFLFVLQPDLKPVALDFIGPTKTGKIPMVVQFLIAELGVDLLRMASVHTPTPLATAMSLIAAILIGDIAVSTGLFINEVILYMAVAAIGMFATPSYELGLANRIVRLLLIVSVAVFKVPGFVVATTVVLVLLVMQRSFNRPYMWPFIPFDFKAMMSIIVRVPVLHNRTRPNLLRPKQRDKMPRTD
ncbi:GerA spore germination protein [Paenibacillus curdlanolyticus YK9]|uniref:GerA spore germination protein n=1 Tax=Paenibacillus curdlanolyticus YK9 TaxID=717606 RepID=E0ICE9_9BACL|nr:spore germination protein [Paenibacillus curdlanolyticus]EFM09835.1 GerA spore germination protein [Paenibacillus curdlanolyticus YK9]